MLHRRLAQFCQEQRPVWVFLRDQQRWIERATVVAVEAEIVTFRYQDEDGDAHHSWEESVRLDSIGAVSSRLASVSRSGDDLPTTGDCPEAERLGQQP